MYLYGIYNGYEILLVGVGGQVKVNGTYGRLLLGPGMWKDCGYLAGYKSSKHLTYWIIQQQDCTDMHIYG